MIADVLTVARKEWKEIFSPGGSVRGGRVSLAILLGMFGVFMPWQYGRDWIDSPDTLLYWGWMPLMIVSGAVADSFAGERERHTLETLLASRLPDEAILFGKILAAVAYAWGMVMGMLALGLVTVNVTARTDGPVLYSWTMVVAAPLLSLAGACVAAGAGVLVSLRAQTVRQAAQTLNIAVLLLVFVPVLALQALPAGSRASLAAWGKRVGASGILGAAVLALATLAIVLIGAARVRFRRARLILD